LYVNLLCGYVIFVFFFRAKHCYFHSGIERRHLPPLRINIVRKLGSHLKWLDWIWKLLLLKTEGVVYRMFRLSTILLVGETPDSGYSAEPCACTEILALRRSRTTWNQEEYFEPDYEDSEEATSDCLKSGGVFWIWLRWARGRAEADGLLTDFKRRKF